MTIMNHDFLAKGGEMGALTRAKDWSKTLVGPVDLWPQSLRTTLALLLNSKFPMFLFWGPELICFYNDAYRPSLGDNGKHPFILGKKGIDAWPETWDFIKPLIDQVLLEGEATWHEDQLLPICRNGKMEDVYWTFSYSPVNNESGKPAGVLVICNETTEKVNIVRKLEDSNNRYLNNIMQAPNAMCILRGSDFVVEIANDLMLEIWRREKQQVMNNPFFKALPEASGQGLEDILQKVYTTGEKFIAYELPITLTRNGEIDEKTFINVVYEALKEADGTISGIVAIANDVTLQVIARNVIEESEKKFRLLADSMPQHVWTSDAMGNLNYFNQSICTYSGISKSDIEKNGWLQIIHPDDREENINVWMEAVKTGNDFLLEHRFRRYDGEYRWQLSRAIAQKDQFGNIQMWVGTSTDVEDQKNFTSQLEKEVFERTAELESKNKDLIKMNIELESFAYISSHDLQEPLRKIQTFVSRLIDSDEQNISAKDKIYLHKIDTSAKRMQTLIQDLLIYSRTNSAERVFVPSNLDEIAEEVKSDFSERIEETNAIVNFHPLGYATVIPFQFRQLLHNLIGNALKFSKKEVVPYIEIKAKNIKGKNIKPDIDFPEKIYLHIQISDNGIGFDKEYKERIFDVFQRLNTENEFAGTGIGLAIVKKIVENHNGFITAESEKGKGATFDIYFPEI